MIMPALLPPAPFATNPAFADLDLVDPATGLVHNGMDVNALVDWPQSYNDSMVQSPWNAVVQARVSSTSGLLFAPPASARR